MIHKNKAMHHIDTSLYFYEWGVLFYAREKDTACRVLAFVYVNLLFHFFD